MEQQRADQVGRIIFNQIFGIAGVAVAVAVSSSNGLPWARIAVLGVAAITGGILLGQLAENLLSERQRLPFMLAVTGAAMFVPLAFAVVTWPMIFLGYLYGIMTSGLTVFLSGRE